MTNVTRQSYVSSLQKIVAGMDQNLSGKTVVLNGKVWKVSDLRAAFQAVIDLFSATTASQQAWRKGVADEKVARVSTKPDIDALRSYVAATYGTNSSEYAEFGFVARKQGKPSAATTLLRVQKNLATRKARNTMGKKQRLKIKGTLPTSPSSSAPTAPGTPITASAVEPNGANGRSH